MSAGRLRIGLDVRSALRFRCGIARYSVELALALLELEGGPELLLYGASREGSQGVEQLPAPLRSHPRARLFAPWLPAKLVAALARVPLFRTEFLTGSLDLFHHTDLIFVKGFRCPQLLTVHDLAFEHSREFHDPGFQERVSARLQSAIARARVVVAPSQATKQDLVARWKIDPERVSVVPLGGDHVLRVPRGERNDPRGDEQARTRGYLLHVGTLEPRKNLARLVRAHREARRRGLDLDLVLVGAWGWKTEELRAELAKVDDGSVVVRGAVDEPELRAWLEDAVALVYPSLYEGFGLPVAEAFALGVPVVTSARSATQEVAGDAALLVDPESESELTAALLEIRDADRRQRLAELGKRRAERFTWSAAARTTLTLYESVTALHSPRRRR